MALGRPAEQPAEEPAQRQQHARVHLHAGSEPTIRHQRCERCGGERALDEARVAERERREACELRVQAQQRAARGHQWMVHRRACVAMREATLQALPTLLQDRPRGAVGCEPADVAQLERVRELVPTAGRAGRSHAHARARAEQLLHEGRVFDVRDRLLAHIGAELRVLAHPTRAHGAQLEGRALLLAHLHLRLEDLRASELVAHRHLGLHCVLGRLRRYHRARTGQPLLLGDSTHDVD